MFVYDKNKDTLLWIGSIDLNKQTYKLLTKNCVNTLPCWCALCLKCKPYHVEDTAVIIGDAAHAMVPFYGQGMNAVSPVLKCSSLFLLVRSLARQVSQNWWKRDRWLWSQLWHIKTSWKGAFASKSFTMLWCGVSFFHSCSYM